MVFDILYFIGALVVIIIHAPAPARGGGRAVPPVRIQSYPIPKDFIFSKITFSEKGEPIVHFADIAAEDPLTSCPLETLPKDLATAASQLVDKIKDSVSKIRESKVERCSDLQTHMVATVEQLELAFQNQFLVDNYNEFAGALSQYQVNKRIQRATAANSLLMTASDIVKRDCITSIDDKVAIQRLVGQIVMLSGLIVGGWQGLSIAAGGQVVGNLPLFRDDVDKAIELFQHYTERNERGSFLCLYRQMQKMSVLFFSAEPEETFGGLNLSFTEGAVKLTSDSIEKIKGETPDLLDDLVMIRTLTKSSEALFAAMEKPDDIRNGSFELLHKLRDWCRKAAITPLKALKNHWKEYQDNLTIALTSLKTNCENLNYFSWKGQTLDENTHLLIQTYGDLTTVRGYFNAVHDPDKSSDKPDDKSDLTDMIKTWESMDFFETLKKTLQEYKGKDGNQVRMNYRILTKRLGNGLVKETFHQMMKENYKTFGKHSWENSIPIHDPRVRRRALQAMLDLCQTLDPTLTRLYIDLEDSNPLQKEWTKHCAGPKSHVCKKVIGKKEEKTLLSDPHYRAYFYSLCGKVIFESLYKPVSKPASTSAPKSAKGSSTDGNVRSSVP